ncbi:hypothetical protein JG688_00013498 [Phytophthora aleatoria]|uniref:Uncharacterized protein n=1 Tax=Phytophthora aleatoria TaxID=2496075 RepID=A0A8J5IZZ1_9STRA|nr:hypothetical protein JG688_00013498 [Phytophthora aleatoria]
MSRHETNGCGGGYVEAEATITTLWRTTKPTSSFRRCISVHFRASFSRRLLCGCAQRRLISKCSKGKT